MADPVLNEHGLPQRRRERSQDEGLDVAQAAQQEQARRILARRRLLPFILRNDPEFKVAWFHRRITSALERFSAAVANEESPRLIIQMPPRAGKSEIVSRNFPAWHLGRYPDHEVIACSYGSDLARDFSRKVRGQLRDDGYHAVFPDVELDPGSQSVDRWNIDGHAGGYVAAGVGGPITGRGMNCLSADTNIATENGERRIDSLYDQQEPLRVWSYNIEHDRQELKRVVAWQVSTNDWLYTIRTTSGRTVRATPEHRFYVPGVGYVEARDLQVGTSLQLANSTDKVAFLSCEDVGPTPVYDIQVEDNENFYANGILTHNCGIIDDYVKNWEEADSTAARDKLWNWYSSTFKSRMAPGGGIIIMATRWNSDDLIGRVLEEEGEIKDGGKWQVIKFPAEALEDEYDEDGITLLRRKGEALHPERYDNDYYDQFKANARIWWALYQQQPIVEGGNYFVKENFKTYRAVERPSLDELVIVSTWDFAVGQNEQNDFTVGAVGGIDRDYKVWALEQVRGQWDSMDTVNEIIDIYKTWQPDIWGFEHGQISLAIGPFLNRRLVEEGIWDLDIEEAAMKTGRKDKVMRAKPLQGFIRTGHFLWPEESSWFKPALNDEFMPFPRGVHDDQVDAWAWMGQKAEQFITQGVMPVRTARVDKYHEKPWRDRLREQLAGRAQGGVSWKTS